MLLLDVTVVNVALPDIQRELDASLSSLQWVVDAYSLMLAAFLLTAGSLGDRLGRRRVFTIGFGVFLARGLQGIGAAGMFATSLALIGQEFHGRDRATAFGVWGAVVGGAVAVGLNSILLIAAVVSLAGAALGFLLTRSSDFVQPTGGPGEEAG